MLKAPIAGVDHPERAFLACAAFARHTSTGQIPGQEMVGRLLTPERRQRALALGATLRLGCDLSGRSPELLARTRLDFKAGVVILQAEEAWMAILLGDQAAKRAQTVANLLDRDLKLRAMAPRSRTFAPAG